MTLYYSFRELLANFTTMWKILLYRLIVLLLAFSMLLGLALPTLTYIFDEIQQTGFFTNLSGFIGALFKGGADIGNFGEAFRNNIMQAGSILVANMGKLVLTYVYILLALCLSRFLNCIADYAVSEVINCHMTACVRVGFVSSIFANLGKAIKYALAKILFTIPYDGLLIALLVYLFVALFTPLGLFMPFVVALIAIIFIAFRMTVLSGWLPSIVMDGNTTFGGLKEGARMVFTHFWSVYSNWIIIIFLAMVMTIMIGLFTFGVGLFVIIPMFALLNSIFYLVFNCTSDGKRYYIDHENIVTPKTLYDRENDDAKSDEIKDDSQDAV